MTQPELGAFVKTHLRDRGISLVLSGSAVVSIYSSGRYVSLDLDMVNVYSARFGLIRTAMQEIGFEERARYFMHPHSHAPYTFTLDLQTLIDRKRETIIGD